MADRRRSGRDGSLAAEEFLHSLHRNAPRAYASPQGLRKDVMFAVSDATASVQSARSLHWGIDRFDRD